MSSNKSSVAFISKKRVNKIMLIIYMVIVAFILYFLAALGTALDLSMRRNKMEMELIGGNLGTAFTNPSLVFQHLKNGKNAAQLMGFGALAIGIFILYKTTKPKKRFHRQGTEHGSAKWGDEAEMQEIRDAGKDSKFPHKEPQFKPLLTPDGERVFDNDGELIGAVIDNNILLTKEVHMSLNARQHLKNLNVLIVGGSGSGKTRFYAIPNIMQLNTSYVITDPKGEILQATGKMLTDVGYDVRVINITGDLKHTCNYNPFNYVYNDDGSVSQAKVMTMVRQFLTTLRGDDEKDDFWSQSAESLIKSIILLLFEESEYNSEFDENGKIKPETRNFTILNFTSVIKKMLKVAYPPSGQEADFKSPLDLDFDELESRKPDNLALTLYKQFRIAPAETGQSIVSTANSKLGSFALPEIQDLTCCDTVHLETLGDRKSALFLIISATDSTFNFLVSLLYTQMFDTLAERAKNKYAKNGKQLPIHVRCILDEFANIGTIPDFEKVIAFVRSFGISLNVIIQTIDQLKVKYEKTMNVIFDNCDSILFLGGKGVETTEQISKMLGKETIDVESKNLTVTGGHKNDSTAESNSILGRELMLPDEIAKMAISDCVLMIRTHNPFYCTKYPLEEHPNFRFTEGFDENNAFDANCVKVRTYKELLSENIISEPSEMKVEIQSEETGNKLLKRYPLPGTEDVVVEVTSVIEPLEFVQYADINEYGDEYKIDNVEEIYADSDENYVRFIDPDEISGSIEFDFPAEPDYRPITYHDDDGNEGDEDSGFINAFEEPYDYDNNEHIDVSENIEEFIAPQTTYSVFSINSSMFALNLM